LQAEALNERRPKVTSNAAPKGEERKVGFVGGVSIDGTPIAYIIVWSALLAVLSFIPIPVSVVFGIGGTFPLSQALYALVGFVLGPWAGALAAGVGRLIGIFAAPHTATVGLPSVLFAVVWAAAGGILVQKRGRSWLLALAIFVLAYVAFVGRALTIDVNPGLAVLNTLTNLSGLILWVLPTRALARSWITDQRPAKLAAGLALGSWIANTLGHTFSSAWSYYVQSWPANVWRILIPIIPVEQLLRVVVGTVVGTGVILGLRAIGLVRPTKAGY
jgi:hypothetical protein